MVNPNRFRAGKNASVSKEGRTNRGGTGQVHSRKMGIDLNPPTGLSAIPSETSVSVSFTAPAGDTPTNFLYALSTNGGSTYGAYTALSPADFTSPITISGLTANQAYVSKFKSFMDGEESNESETLSFATLAGAPTGLSASSITHNSFVLSFTQPAGGGQTITNYKYALSTNGGATYEAYVGLSPADSTSPITITGLSGGVTYAIKIRAVTAAGDGTESAALTGVQTNPYGAATGGTSSTITVGGQSFTLLTFTGTSTLTITRAGQFDVLVVGGGGGGASSVGVTDDGGGGGGGGGIAQALLVTISANQTVTVGGGGNPGSIDGTTGYPGEGGGASSVSSVVSVGGGGGGQPAGPGGASGGGSGAGGHAGVAPPYPGAAGGGGGAGGDISSFLGQGAGTTRRGGGGGGGGGLYGPGGAGGAGGGGNGSAFSGESLPVNGGTNTGGGGGGGSRPSDGRRWNGASGGSGVVYVRFRN